MGYGSKETGRRIFSPSYRQNRVQALPPDRDNNVTAMPQSAQESVIRQIPKSAGDSIHREIPRGAAPLRGGYTGDINKK